MLVNRTTIPTHQLTPLIAWVLDYIHPAVRNTNILITFKKRGGGVGGKAMTHAMASGREARGMPGGEALVRILIAVRWEHQRYPMQQTYKKRAGTITYRNWQEHFVVLVAHEFRHIEQFNEIDWKPDTSESMEVDAERFAMKLLEKYRKDPVTQPLSIAARRETKQCPRCGRTGDVAEVFGYRTIKGRATIPQSYCHDCRRAHARERRS